MELDSSSSPRETSDQEEDFANAAHVQQSIEDAETNVAPPIYESNSSDFEPGQAESDGESSEAEDLPESRISTPLKHAIDEDEAPVFRPFKRKKANGKVTKEYLDLLNQEILDAARGEVAPPPQSASDNPKVGFVQWSAAEKEAFFKALPRLGQHDIPGMAEVIAKGEVEIHHFLSLLQQSASKRRQISDRPTLVMSDHPAALELSQQCSHAQEEAADELSLRFERIEQKGQERVWGEIWDITPSLASFIDKERKAYDLQAARGNEDEAETSNGKMREDDATTRGQAGPKPLEYDLPCSALFYLSPWLSLSRRMFMNSAIPANNWRNTEATPPSMWATTFEDFHALAVTYTRRLVQTTIFFATKRIRHRIGQQYIQDTVIRAQDVRPAVQSLGLPLNSQQFWKNSARRLRLNVYDEPPMDGDEEDAEPLSYDEVEQFLQPGQSNIIETEAEGHDDTNNEEVKPDTSPSADEHMDAPVPQEQDEDSDLSLGDEAAEIRDEALEVFEHTAAKFSETKRMKNALLHRIARERRQEEEADKLDQFANWQEETKMWKILRLQPPMAIPRPSNPGTPHRSNRKVDDVLTSTKTQI